MRIPLSIIASMLCLQSMAQDIAPITYSVTEDTLVKQRFIDRYENVFMTKVPTRHMFKIGMEFYPVGRFEFGGSGIQAGWLTAGYEFKLTPSISLGANVKTTGSWMSSSGWRGNLAASFQGRWYFDMNRRIAEGRSANNFSGNYLAVIAENNWDDYYSNRMRLGVEFGMQRRFLNNGVLDFAAGVYYHDNPYNYANVYRKINDFEISTRTTLGFAFGDWKKAEHISACDVFRCDEVVYSQWKVFWPTVKISHTTSISLGLAYERKLGNSPVSVNTQLSGDYLRMAFTSIFNSEIYNSNFSQFRSSVQVRYYFLQKHSIRKGRGGNNLSGFYAGPAADYVYFNDPNYGSKRHLGAGFTYGYQQTLFRNAFIDISGTQSWNLIRYQSGTKRMGSFKVGFGLTF
ncbi:MAG TPA: hypothetical protein VGN64_09940 [Dyadobacter sp.]|jgi:hypothetical protein|nr:hypothetical protein [Dyadobacter sp.]